MLLALNSPELKVEALTVVPGNVTAAQGLDNALELVRPIPLSGVAPDGGRGPQAPLVARNRQNGTVDSV
jgi:inosine-uridine nucleoside N-ribohydrolase